MSSYWTLEACCRLIISSADLAPKSAKQRPILRCSGGWCIRPQDSFCVIGAVVLLIASTSTLDLLVSPTSRPLYLIISYPIVGLAWKLPSPNRGRQRHCLTVVRKIPLSGFDRRHNSSSAPASAEMRSCSIPDRYVEAPFFENCWNFLDELVT